MINGAKETSLNKSQKRTYLNHRVIDIDFLKITSTS